MNKLDFSSLEMIPKSSNFSLLEQIFINLKEKVPNYYAEGNFHYTYKEYMRKLLHYRLKMNPEYICDVSILDRTYTEDDILNFIVFKLREYVLLFLEGKYQSINEVDLTDGCVVCSLQVKSICDALKIPCEKVEIYPGYDAKARLFGMCGFHYFNIVTIFGKRYIVDTTYKQFFKKSNCFLEEIGVPLTCAPAPGIFMQQTETRQRVANKILKDGWIELTDETLKAYCDGFTLSYRNGLYYETFNSNKFITLYNSEDYMNFLEGKDTQINHEPLECLGPLKKTLKKPIFFSK